MHSNSNRLNAPHLTKLAALIIVHSAGSEAAVRQATLPSPVSASACGEFSFLAPPCTITLFELLLDAISPNERTA